MSKVRRQAVIEAPVENVWELVGDPRRHPEWFPRVVEVNGERFEEGEEYAQVTRDPNGKVEKTDFMIERLDNLHEIRFACQKTGMYAHWLLTDAQGDTFVEVEMGMQPKRVGLRVFDAVAGRRYFTRWLDQSLDALRRVTGKPRSG
jgi:uncharacterized protein YndB with AHSA1/START domain